MAINFKKGFFVSAIWLMPVLLVLIEALLFLSKTNRQSEFIAYFITF
jgi:hypothetical protein